jgi:hypothetical protein
MQRSTSTNELTLAATDRFANTSPSYGAPSAFQAGRNSQDPLATATALTDKVPLETTETVDNADSTSGWSATTDGSVTLNTTTGQYVQGTGCLNLVKTGATVDNVTYSKTTSSLDYTSKDLWSWFYVDDLDLLAASDAVEVRYGSDSSNYYYARYDKTALEEGSNWLKHSSSTADGTVGTPTITACAYYAIKITYAAASTTVSAPSIRLDHLQLASSDDYELSYDSGYPQVSLSGNKVRSIATLKTSMAAGQRITNFGWFTSTGELYGIDLMTAANKTQDEEWQVVDEVEFVRRKV